MENECATELHLIDFKELDFTVVAEVHEYHVDFKIYDVIAWEYFDQSGHHKRTLLPRIGSTSGNEYTENLDEAEVYLSGEVKWDGCSNWRFDEQERCMLHGCCREDIQRFGDVMAACWDWASEILPNWQG